MVFMKGFVTGALVTAGTIFAAAAISVFRENRLAMRNMHRFDLSDYNTEAYDTDANSEEQANTSEIDNTATVAETDSKCADADHEDA